MADHVIDNLGDKLELKQNLERLLEEEGYIEKPELRRRRLILHYK